ncbi:MAG TPA: cation diffusion facilitator family transporter [Pseudonocardiaceae bacterium]|nr:cation diffusion facilitator family transporter [Pseudonocardiaceae bacterium]
MFEDGGHADRHDETADRAAAHRAIAVSAVGLAATGLAELAVALITGSVALLGDALHNLSDVSTSAVVFLGFRISRRPASASHPYGYERAEDLAGLGVALVIWLSAVFAGVESYRKLVGHASTHDIGLGIAAAALGIIGNQVVAAYKRRIGRRIGSATLIADAQHSWLDALSSAGALVGLVLVAFGQRWGDPVAGLAVTAFIVHVGYEVTHDLLDRLMDGVAPEVVDAARRAAEAVPGVSAVSVRGRWTGRTLRLRLDVALPGSLPLTQADAVTAGIETAVLDAVPEARSVRCSARSA